MDYHAFEQFSVISVGDLLNKEVQKRSEYGREIEESRQNYSYVKDEIVIELVRKQIQEQEEGQISWIIEGFPRTEMQAIALMKMGIIPDKFILLTQNDELSIQSLHRNIDEICHRENDSRKDELARNSCLEYNLKIEGVKQVCKGFITELEAKENKNLVLEEIVRVLKLKSTKAPRRPQRIILMGPPGSEKENLASKVAKKYQLVYVQVHQLIKDAIRRDGNSEFAKTLAQKLDSQDSSCKSHR